MSTILIRQIPDDYSESTGLNKYGRSRMPGCKDSFSASLNVDDRFVTNLDEDAYGVKPEDATKILELRKSLEKRTGKDLSGTSPFWRDFYVIIDSDRPRMFDTTNAMDTIAYNLLIANKNVAPSKDAAYTPEYKDAQYYAYTEEGEDAEETNNRRSRDKAVSALLSVSEDKDKMLLYGQYLEGLKYTDKLKTDSIFKMLRAYVEDKNIKNSINFLAALAKPVEELQTKNIIDRAIKQRLINKVGVGSKKQVYQFGQVTIGATPEEVYKNLSSPDFIPELMALKTELEKR